LEIIKTFANTAFADQPVKTFDFCFAEKEMFVSSIKHLANRPNAKPQTLGLMTTIYEKNNLNTLF
jgi:hypothetical protein